MQPTHPTYEPTVAPSTISPTVAPSMEPSVNPTFAPVSANAPVVTVQATQTVAGVTSDSADFRTAFASAVMSLLPTGSSVTIDSVTVVDVRRRQLLTKAVSVVYTVQSTAPASALTSTLSSGTAAMTAVLQQSYPAAVVAVPTVVTIANPTAAPTTTPPVTSSSTASSATIVPGIVVGSVVGFIVFLALILYRRHQLQKRKKILVDVVEQDNEKGGLDEVVDPEPTIKPVRQSMEGLPLEGENSSAAIVPHNLPLAPVDDNGGLNNSDELIEEGHVHEAIPTPALPSTPATDSKFPFNIRSPFLGLEGRQSPKQLSLEDGDTNDEDGDDALVDKSHIFNFIQSSLEVQGWFSSKQSSLGYGGNGDGDVDDALVDKPHLFNFIRSSLEVQGWFSSKCSLKQSSVTIGDGDDDNDGDDDGDALVGKSYITYITS